jgi:hypothetical protein
MRISLPAWAGLTFATVVCSLAAAALFAAEPAAKKGEKLLRHVVLFKFKDTSSPADVQKVV